MEVAKILNLIPQKSPFRFIDQILEVNDQFIIGSYKFKKDEFFYQGHFPSKPVTPGVILTETAAQIGLVAFGIYLENQKKAGALALKNLEENNLSPNFGMAFTSVEMDYLKPVFPEDQVFVKAEKVYFRFNKLKVKAKMYFESDEIICKGELSGMFGSGSI